MKKKLGSTQTIDKAMMETMDARMVECWGEGQLGSRPKLFFGYALTSGGMATIYLTKNGTPTGDPVFTAINQEHGVLISPKANDKVLLTEVYSLSEDLKTLTVRVNQTTSVLLGLLQFVGVADNVPVSVLVYGQ